MMVTVCLAAKAPIPNDDSSWSYFLTTVVLMATLTAAALLIVWLGRWMRRPPGDVSSGDELTRFRSLYERGELNREEYERIKAKLVPRLRKELDLPAAPKETPPAPGNDKPDAPPAAPPGPNP